jgi:hypothetical protein
MSGERSCNRSYFNPSKGDPEDRLRNALSEQVVFDSPVQGYPAARMSPTSSGRLARNVWGGDLSPHSDRWRVGGHRLEVVQAANCVCQADRGVVAGVG